MGRIDEVLREMADPGYRAFQMRLIPTVDPARVIGVRVPDLRRYARTIAEVLRRRPFGLSCPMRAMMPTICMRSCYR